MSRERKEPIEKKPISPVSVVFLSRLSNGAGEARKNMFASKLWSGRRGFGKRGNASGSTEEFRTSGPWLMDRLVARVRSMNRRGLKLSELVGWCDGEIEENDVPGQGYVGPDA